MTALDAATKADLKRTYVQDLLAGKKANVSGSALVALSKVLQCSPEYLVLGQAEMAAAKDGKIPIIGICQIGMWRENGVHLDHPDGIVAKVPEYPTDVCVAFIVNGSGAEDIGILPQSIVIGVPPAVRRGRERIEDGDVVVIRRHRPEVEQSEVSIRKVARIGNRIEFRIPSKNFSAAKVLSVASGSSLTKPPFEITIRESGSETISVLAVVLRSVVLIGG